MVGRWLLPILVTLTPLFFLTLTPNPFATPKQILFFVSLLIITLAWGFQLFRDRVLTLSQSPLYLPLLLFALALSVNLIFQSEGRLEALIGRGSLYLFGLMLAFFTSLIPKPRQAVTGVIYAIIISSTLLALHGLLQLTFLHNLTSLPAWLSTRAFTPTGSPLVTVTWLLIGAVTSFYYSLRTLKGNWQYAGFFLGILQTVASVAYISLMLPGGELNPTLLPYQASWSVTLDALKSPRTFLIGVGLANFPLLFTAVKPIFLNAGPFWNTIPATATSELLQLLSTAGILGLASFLLIPLTVLFHSRQISVSRTLKLVFTLAFVSMVLTPVSIPILVLFFVCAGLLLRGEPREVKLSRQLSLAISAFTLVVMLSITYLASRVILAEINLGRAAKALAANDGKTVYETHLRAISLVPQLSGYHLSFSQVNLSLASALSQKADLSEAERGQVATLISQAVREAKLAANLRPNDARTWENLGILYRNLVNVADGSDQFAVSAYAQAVKLDPGNPALRVEFGGLLYQLSATAKDAETKNSLLNRAVQEFQTAIQLKPDFANGYYNLAKALESAGNYPAAYAAMQKVIASLDPASEDLPQATSELEALKAKVPSPRPSGSPAPLPNTSGTSELSAPSPLPSPITGGPVDLPEDSPLPSPSPLAPSPSPES